MPDASSAGIGTIAGAYGKTCRKDVLRGKDTAMCVKTRMFFAARIPLCA
jgi:hypothetical protein